MAKIMEHLMESVYYKIAHKLLSAQFQRAGQFFALKWKKCERNIQFHNGTGHEISYFRAAL
jgi:hypothetical protein